MTSPPWAPSLAFARPFAGPVNPQRSYSAEPAPMGVADFGVNGQDQPYSYSTSIFEGTMNITSLRANDVVNPSAGNVAFELNTMLTFDVGSKAYVYWLQDGFDVESHSEHVSLLQDYVWNFTAASATLNSSSVAGNGSFVNAGGYNIYISYPPKSLPGNNINLSFPLALGLRIVTGTAGPNGVPWVGYDYRDGFGWVRGSNVSFPFAGGASAVGQTVNGNTYTPNGAYYDAEIVYAGPGGGVGTDVGSHMTIALDRWNGVNLQAVPNAYNHGGDTGERIQNLTVVSNPLPGAPGSTVSDGAGTLGLLYDSNQTGTLDVLAPGSGGTFGLNGEPIAFTGAGANLTLVPGVYELTLLQASVIVGHTSVTVTAGSNQTVDLVANLIESVTITAAGLPMGTAWSIDWNGTSYHGTAPSIRVASLNGSYRLTTSAIPGFRPKTGALMVVVRGPTAATIEFTTFNYTVTFTSAGLPMGVAWWVVSNGVTNRSTGTSLSMALPNGTDAYAVGCDFAFLPLTPRGNVTVLGGPTGVDISFARKPSYLVGTLAPASAVLEVDGVVAPVSLGTFNVSLLPGSYEVTASLAGYTSFSTNVTTTAGNTTSVTIALRAMPVTSPTSASGPGFTEPLLIVTGIGAAIVAGVALAVVRFRRRPPAP